MVRLADERGFLAADPLSPRLASEAGMVGERTLVVTTVHERQVLPVGAIPAAEHDVRLDLIVTPDRVIEVPRTGARPVGRIRWDELTEDKIAAIPLLARLREAGQG